MSYNLKKCEILKTVHLNLETLPLRQLEEYKEHRRLKLYYHKGTTCVECGRVGTKFLTVNLKFKNSSITKHRDIFTDDNIMITVDHILPLSKGGAREDLSNMQVMCQFCNSKKGNTVK